MTELEDVAFLVATSYRSRAYSQLMAQAGLCPSVALALPGDEPLWDGPEEVKAAIRNDGTQTSFRPGEPAGDSLRDARVPVVDAPTRDVNSDTFIAFLQEIEQPVVIYSGFGGVLLREPLLECGKRFLHIHGGYAPAYKGSTAFYYSILKDGNIGATALWLVKEIDSGPILMRREYPVPDGIEIDRVIDPMVRADLLCQVLEKRRKTGRFPEGAIDSNEEVTYHVIHPVLKHLALRKCSLTTPGDGEG